MEQAELDRQNGTGRAGILNRTGRTGQAEWVRQKGTDRKEQAEQDRQNRQAKRAGRR
jgi:hypothetical protein